MRSVIALLVLLSVLNLVTFRGNTNSKMDLYHYDRTTVVHETHTQDSVTARAQTVNRDDVRQNLQKPVQSGIKKTVQSGIRKTVQSVVKDVNPVENNTQSTVENSTPVAADGTDVEIYVLVINSASWAPYWFISNLPLPKAKYIRVAEKDAAWEGTPTKVRWFNQWLLTKKHRPNDLVVFLDADIMWGGCDLDLLSAYNQITKKSGASIIFGAEYCCCCDGGKDFCDSYPPAPYGLWTDNNTPFNQKTAQQWYVQECPTAAGTKTPEMKYLNSGTIMGRVSALLEMTTYILQEPYMSWRVTNGDQVNYAAYFLTHPRTVTLDYERILFSTMAGLKANTFERRKDYFWDNWAQRKYCWLHFNGAAAKKRATAYTWTKAMYDNQRAKNISIFPSFELWFPQDENGNEIGHEGTKRKGEARKKPDKGGGEKPKWWNWADYRKTFMHATL